MAATHIRYSPELEDAVAQGDVLRTYDAIRDAVSSLADRIEDVRLVPAWTGSEEGAEVGGDGASLILTILPKRFADPIGLMRFLRHELGHVADVLDVTFGHGMGIPDEVVLTDGLRRRFKLLWACSVDGRTALGGGAPLHSRDEYESEFARLFPGLPRGVAGAAVAGLWEGERPPYCRLVRVAAELAVYPDAPPSRSGPDGANLDRRP